ncbi:MAG: flagellar assembly protein FliW [Sporichthyaceae bacterium]
MTVPTSEVVPAQRAAVAEPAAGELPTLEFVGPVAGFPEHRSFVLAEIDPASMVRALRSLQDPDVRFLVVPPGPFFPDYVPELTDEWAEALGLTAAADALVLVILNPGAALADATVNLLAPVVINTGTRRAAQIVLGDPALPMRAPLGIG